MFFCSLAKIGGSRSEYSCCLFMISRYCLHHSNCRYLEDSTTPHGLLFTRILAPMKTYFFQNVIIIPIADHLNLDLNSNLNFRLHIESKAKNSSHKTKHSGKGNTLHRTASKPIQSTSPIVYGVLLPSLGRHLSTSSMPVAIRAVYKKSNWWLYVGGG